MEGRRGKKWRVEHPDGLQRGSASIRSGEALKPAGLDAPKRESLSPYYGACPIERPFQDVWDTNDHHSQPFWSFLSVHFCTTSEGGCEFVWIVSLNPK